MTFRDELQHKLALGMDKWFTGISDELPTWFHREGLFLGIGDDVGSVAVASLFDSDLRTTEADWRAKRIELGLEKRPEPGVTPKEDDAWNEKRMDAIGINGGEALHYGMTPVEAVEWSEKDTGAHYRHSYRAKVSQDDADRGYVEVKLDPYRICDIYQTGGGPREHIVKKGLRGLRKGDTERGLIKQLRDALDRWEEMLDEDEGKKWRN